MGFRGIGAFLHVKVFERLEAGRAAAKYKDVFFQSSPNAPYF